MKGIQMWCLLVAGVQSVRGIWESLIEWEVVYRY